MLQSRPGSLEWISSEWESSLQTLTTNCSDSSYSALFAIFIRDDMSITECLSKQEIRPTPYF
jgi:hypothetical protein